MPTSQGYIFYILQDFTAELCNFTKHRMLFQAVVIFLPIFKFHVKGERSICVIRILLPMLTSTNCSTTLQDGVVNDFSVN